MSPALDRHDWRILQLGIVPASTVWHCHHCGLVHTGAGESLPLAVCDLAPFRVWPAPQTHCWWCECCGAGWREAESIGGISRELGKRSLRWVGRPLCGVCRGES